MHRFLYCLFFLSIVSSAQQREPKIKSKLQESDTLVVNSGKKDSLKVFVPTINDYHFFTQNSEKKFFDTLLTANKSYAFSQYTNKDIFGKIQFANIGSGYNTLSYSWNNFDAFSLIPTNKSYGIIQADQIKYYDVKTPTTTFVFHNGVSNGAALYSTYTQNIGKRFNFAVEYFGLRSLGGYQNALAVSNNTSVSAHFISKRAQYELFAHYIHQNIINQENGGITPLYDALYQTGDKDINNRQTIPVLFSNSNSRFAYRRYYLSQLYSPFDVSKLPLKLKHTLQHQGNKYYYEMGDSDVLLFPDAIPYKSLSSKKYSENLSNTFSVLYDAPKFRVEAGIKHQWISLATNTILLAGNPILPEYKENRLGVIGNLWYQFSDQFNLNSSLDVSRGSDFGNYINTQNSLSFQPIPMYFVKANLNYRSSVPGFNFLLNSSPILRYTNSLSDFKNENSLNFGGEINLKWWQTKFSTQLFRIDQMTYFDSLGQAKQSSDPVSISQISGESTFKYGSFYFSPQVFIQNNFSGKEVMPLPQFIARANLYYLSRAFNNKAEIQAGMKIYYFSKFNSREYSPILNDYILPGTNSFAIGGQPIADAYFNFKVKKMFFFVEGQHFTTLLSPNKVYTAPHYPYFDFRLNMGIVWYLFS